jgi:hypothetical protein
MRSDVKAQRSRASAVPGCSAWRLARGSLLTQARVNYLDSSGVPFLSSLPGPCRSHSTLSFSNTSSKNASALLTPYFETHLNGLKNSPHHLLFVCDGGNCKATKRTKGRKRAHSRERMPRARCEREATNRYGD